MGYRAKGNILIVEDDPKNMKLFRDILQFRGYDTLEAADGGQGVVLAKAHKPDLVIMDMQLPVMDGVEATKAIKNDDETRDIIVLAVTAFAMSGDREKMLAAGCCDYIAKPIHVPDFLDMVEKYLLDRERTRPAGKKELL